MEAQFLKMVAATGMTRNNVEILIGWKPFQIELKKEPEKIVRTFNGVDNLRHKFFGNIKNWDGSFDDFCFALINFNVMNPFLLLDDVVGSQSVVFTLNNNSFLALKSKMGLKGEKMGEGTVLALFLNGGFGNLIPQRPSRFPLFGALKKQFDLK